MAELVQELIGVNFNTPFIYRKEDQVGTEEKIMIVEIQYQEEENPSAEKYSKHNHWISTDNEF